MKLNVHTVLFVITMSAVVSGCGEDAEVKEVEPVVSEKSAPIQEQTSDTEVRNEGLYDLKNSINSAIGDSIEEDIRDAVESQVEKNNNE